MPADFERPHDGDITELLAAWRAGRPGAVDTLFPLVYRELRAMARRQLGANAGQATLGPTALVHEAYLKLVDHTQANVQDRHHFFAVAARAMRQILVDYVRNRRARKRGGGQVGPLDTDSVPVDAQVFELLAIDRALTRLEALDERLARLVELRVFAGLSVEEAAEALGISERTVKRDWQKARAFLFHELRPAPRQGSGQAQT
jgi:RNA polymerase sigma factor (TIGR02999 family)